MGLRCSDVHNQRELSLLVGIRSWGDKDIAYTYTVTNVELQFFA